MKWATLANVHFNTDNINGFMWRDGTLLIEATGGKITHLPDPDKRHYESLCLIVGVAPVQERKE